MLLHLTLKEIASHVIEIHSQFSEQGLLDNATHLKTLDDFGEYKEQLNEISEVWNQMKIIENDYSKKKALLDQTRNNLEIYNHDYEELKSLDPKPKEFFGLEKKKKVLNNLRKIGESLNEVLDNFNRENPPGIEILVSSNLNILNKIKDLLDNETSKNIEKLDSIALDLSEISNSLEHYLSKEIESDSLETIDDRVSTYRRLSQKHSVDVENLVDVMDIYKAISMNNQISLNEVQEQLKEQETRYDNICKKLSDEERKAKIMDEKINNELPSLKLENAEFKTIFETSEKNESGSIRLFSKLKQIQNLIWEILKVFLQVENFVELP